MHGGDAADVVAVYALAEKLGKFASEVMTMPASELEGWCAYLEYQSKLKQANGR